MLLPGFYLQVLHLLVKGVPVDAQELGGSNLDIVHLLQGGLDQDLFDDGDDIIENSRVCLRFHVGSHLIQDLVDLCLQSFPPIMKILTSGDRVWQGVRLSGPENP